MSKNIVLCSDGTGNKGGYGNDSNVFKLYQAIDIHKLNSKIQQISFYDNGVGTKENGSAVKSNKIWVTLSGALGLGFKDKVRDLYEFLAYHYQPGDKIYIFGFSRGAATVRAFTGFINTCGLLDKSKIESETEFQFLIGKALMAYEKFASEPELAEKFRDQYAVRDKEYAPDGNLQIQFLGVWDTVSALGFPNGNWTTSDWFYTGMDKLSKAFERFTNKHWPHQFYDYALNDNILYACQALSIDDERKTFCPLVWDESGRQAGSVDQVWFAGVHANVGGGYPLTGLSDVALEWIFKQADDKGLIFNSDDVSATRAHANVQGKLYDSREGFAVYYRYDPRDITKLCKDEGIEDKKINIHSTVIERITQSTSLYAPGFLPDQFQVVSTGSKKKQNIKIDKEKQATCRQDIVLWVEKGQWLYRTFVEITLIMLAMVIFLWFFPPESVKSFLFQESTQSLSFCQGFQSIIEQCIPEAVVLFTPQRWIYDLLVYIFPAIFKNFIVYVVCIQPIIFMLMMVTIIRLYFLKQKYKLNLSKASAKIRLLLLDTFKKL